MAAGIQLGAKYTIIGGPRDARSGQILTPNRILDSPLNQAGTRAVLNDSTDADFVGPVAELTGLEASDVRESSDDNVEGDGAVHGAFYRGRRPITLSVQIGGNTSVLTRNQRQQKYLNSVRAFRRGSFTDNEGVLIWQPTGFPEMFLRFRQQQPSRVTGAWLKAGNVALVADDPRIYSTASYSSPITGAASSWGPTYGRAGTANSNPTLTVTREVTVTNLGDALSPPLLSLTGPISGVTIANKTTGEEISLTGSLAAGQTAYIDMRDKTITTYSTNGLLVHSIPRSLWWGLVPGANVIQLAAASMSGAGAATVLHRYAWA